MKRAEIGAALDSLDADVRVAAIDLVRQYRVYGLVSVLKQAVDTPHRVRAMLAAWIARYEAVHGAGSAPAFLTACLAASGSARSVAQINASLAALETAAQVLVAQHAAGATWDAIATAAETALQPAAPESEDFSYRSLPLPAGYTTVFGERW